MGRMESVVHMGGIAHMERTVIVELQLAVRLFAAWRGGLPRRLSIILICTMCTCNAQREVQRLMELSTIPFGHLQKRAGPGCV